MSAPVHHDTDENAAPSPTMYAPPWARGDAAAAAADGALAASEEFRRTLPPAPLLRRSRRRDPPPFPGDVAIMRLAERPSLDPVVLFPPARKRSSAIRVLARVAGAVALAALAASFFVGTVPLKGVVKAEAETALPSVWSRLVSAASIPISATAEPERPAGERVAALADRFPPQAVEPVPIRVVQTIPVQTTTAADPPEAQPAATPALRSLGEDEIAGLYRRGEQLIAQGDIAAARLLLTRAAEAGHAGSAFALGASFDADVLKKLGVLGVAADPKEARVWYAKAAAFGSGEANRRLEQLAQSR